MKILLLVPKGFELLEFSALFDVLAWAEDLGYGTKVITCGFQKQVIGTFGVSLSVDMLIDDINSADFDALAIPGGFEEYGYYEDVYNSRFLGIIREFHEKNKIITSVCVGALPLGKSGVLAGKKATTYFRRKEELSSFGVNVIDVNTINESLVIDGKIITSSCPGSAINVAFKLLEMLTNKEKAEQVKEAMGF